MVKSLIITTLFALMHFALFSQCKSGNCKTGFGTFDYGWCVYTGEFKNGKPEGKGTMKYDDYTFAGTFADGLEDGQGVILYKNGSKETVRYVAGKKIVSGLVRSAPESYKPLDIQNIRCVSGNCNTGFGTFQFDSGGKYTGNFKDRQFEGEGTFIFANGDKFEGVFHNNEKASGTYHYYTGARYTGTYDSKGMEYNGSIVSPAGVNIPYVNGRPIIPPAPKKPAGVDSDNDPTRPKASGEKIKMACSVCHGAGVQKHVEDWSGPTMTHLVSVSSPCYQCHGSGVEYY